MSILYTPVLKGKEGEYAALEELASDVKDSILPLIEVPGVPFDYANDRPAKSLDEHISGVAKRVERAWAGRAFFLDLPWFGSDERLSDGTLAVERVIRECARSSSPPIPVVRTSSSRSYLQAVREGLKDCSGQFCLRMVEADFDEEGEDPAVATERLLDLLGQSDTEAGTLVLDLGDVGTDISRATLAARSMLSQVPSPGSWQNVVLAAASFPENLSEVSAATSSTLPRLERQLWQRLQKRGINGGPLVFADYAIAHPIPTELDPRTMRMSASIRYSTSDHWLIVKGRNVRQFGFDQYFELARTLVEHADYAGETFSWGDNFIARCARKEAGPGNATTWRKVGTNHHITLVARDLASTSPRASSGSS